MTGVVGNTAARLALRCLTMANRQSRLALDLRRSFGPNDREAKEATAMAAAWRRDAATFTANARRAVEAGQDAPGADA